MGNLTYCLAHSKSTIFLFLITNLKNVLYSHFTRKLRLEEVKQLAVKELKSGRAAF